MSKESKRRYTDSHEWISLEGTIATIGITDYAQKELGEIVFVELPKVGQTVLAGEEAVVLESTKAAADVYAPLSGRVVATNQKAVAMPNLINRYAEAEGWLFQVEAVDVRALDRLMSREEYLKRVGK